MSWQRKNWRKFSHKSNAQMHFANRISLRVPEITPSEIANLASRCKKGELEEFSSRSKGLRKAYKVEIRSKKYVVVYDHYLDYLVTILNWRGEDLQAGMV